MLIPLGAALCLLPIVSTGVALVAGVLVALAVGNPYVERTRRATHLLLSLAVVGLGCVLPNALRVADYWTALSTARVSLTKVPSRAWDHSIHHHPDPTRPDRTHADLGGFKIGRAHV